MKLIMLTLFLSFFSHADPKFSKDHACWQDTEQFCDGSKQPSQQNDFGCLNVRFNDLELKCQEFIVKNSTHKPCISDVMKLCKGSDRNSDRSFICLEENKGLLNPECKKWVDQRLGKARQMTRAFDDICKADFKPCDSLPIGPTRRNCIYKLYDDNKLSTKCRPLVEKAKKNEE